MPSFIKNIFLVVLTYFFNFQVITAQDKVFVLDTALYGYKLNAHTYFLKDSANALTFEQVSSPTFTPKMQQGIKGYQINHKPKITYWYKVTITNQLRTQTQFVYEPCFVGRQEFRIYDTKGKLLKTQQTGKDIPYSQRAWYISPDVIPLSLAYQDTIMVVTRAYEDKREVYPIKDIWLGTPSAYYDAYITKMLWQIMFQGALLLMFLYNILFYWIVRDRAYLYYGLYILFSSLAFFHGNSPDLFITRDMPRLTGYVELSSVFITLFYAQFVRYFLNIPTIAPKLHQYFTYWVYGRLLVNVLLLLNYEQNPNILANNSLVAPMIMIELVIGFVFIAIARKKTPVLALYMIGGYLAIALPIAAALIAQSHTDNMEANAFVIQIGILVELILFSLGLGYRSKELERERFEALQENQRIIEEQNALLEQKVEERTQELNQQKEAIEEQNKNITDNINYARRIQESFLPKQSTIAKHLPEAFIFFQPKDIVSGDFYFFEEVNGKIILGAIDCTGHGVSGAFMTMLGNDILHNLIDNQHIASPDLLLNELHKGVRYALKQHETDNRDGMDLALITIDKQARTVEYAGAKNPLIYIQGGELKLVKADKMPIGGEQKEQERIFAKTTIDISEPTMFYLFSDGYQDQFGGKDNKKFSIARMKELFLSIHTQDMATQQTTLQNTLHQWRTEAGEHQIDDILVVGVRV